LYKARPIFTGSYIHNAQYIEVSFSQVDEVDRKFFKSTKSSAGRLVDRVDGVDAEIRQADLPDAVYR